MKNLILLFIAFIAIQNQSFSQATITIDVVVNAESSNSVVGLNSFIKERISANNEANGCIKYNIISDINAGTNPYILELWESEEFTEKQMFHLTRTTTKTVNDKKVEKSYNVKGVRAKSDIDFFGRLIEKGTTSVIDLYTVSGHMVEEIADDNISNKVKRGKVVKLSEDLDEVYGEELDEKFASIRKKIGKNLLGGANKIVAEKLLPPTTITSIKEKDGDKVKKVVYEKCLEQSFTQYGNLYYGIYSKEEIEGQNAYFKIGKGFIDKDDNVLGVSDGKKEILPLLQRGDSLYIGKEYAMESSVSTADKAENVRDIAFIYFYSADHTFTDADKRNIEFMYQSQFINYRDIRVIAYDPMADKLNATTTKSIFDGKTDDVEEIKTEDVMNGVKHVYVTISKAAEAPKSLLKSSFLNGGEAQDPNARYIFTSTSLSHNGEKTEDSEQLVAYKSKVGLNFYSKKPDIDNAVDAFVDRNVTIIKEYKTDKDKLKEVLIMSNVPLDGGEKYEVFEDLTPGAKAVASADEPEAKKSKRSKRSKGKRSKKDKKKKKKKGKKQKKDGEIKVETVLNRYFAIAKVEKGDKDLKVLMDNKTALRTKKKKGGFFSGGEFDNTLKRYYPKSTKL